MSKPLGVMPAHFPDPQAVLKTVTVAKGALPGPDDISLFSIMRNETYFIESFLHHYRQLGVDSFVILDDNSTQEFHQILLDQKDVTVLQSSLGFGEPISWVNHDGRFQSGRGQHALKEAIPNNLLLSEWNFMVDADEFLVLHPDFPDLPTFFQTFTESGPCVFYAQMVDMFPKSWPIPDDQNPPQTFEDLAHLYPMFKGSPAFSRDSGRFVWDPMGNGGTEIFRREKIYAGPPWKRAIKRALNSLHTQDRFFEKTPVAKVPLLGPHCNQKRLGAHHSSSKDLGPVVMALCHFLMHKDLRKKTEFAVSAQSGYLSKQRYGAFQRFLAAIESQQWSPPGHFIEFHGAESFLDSGHIEHLY